MPQTTILWLTVLVTTSYCANVLVLAGLQGSHLFVSLDVADKLAGFGHDVTVVSLFGDSRIKIADRAFRFIAISDESEARSYFEWWDGVFERQLHLPSADMMLRSIELWAFDDEAKLWLNESNSIYLRYFKGERFSELLNTGNFDLIVVEDFVSDKAMDVLRSRDIPRIGLICHAGAGQINGRFGLPGLANSVPSFINNITNSPPTFVERWNNLVKLGRFLKAIIAIYEPILQDEPPKTRKNLEFLTVGTYDVAFVNDHPAFSFPFLTPPNTFYLGPFNLENHNLKPLPDDYQEFLATCPHKYVIYLSFGSYLRDITSFSRLPSIIWTLRQMGACVIIKSKLDLRLKFDLPVDKFFQRAWIPQKDLLGSGKLDFFISHCGNNGRLEAIYYNVPLLCIPLFGEQYFNGRLVERNGFGRSQTWETLTEETLLHAIGVLLAEQETIVANMKLAVEIARNDPGAGTDALRFYSDVLIKNQNADYLINRIIMNQSATEIYNLDIGAIILIVTISLVAGILFCLAKCFQFCFCKITRKIKAD